MTELRHAFVGVVGVALIALAILFVHVDGGKASVPPAPSPVRVAAVHLVPAERTASYAAVIVPRIEADVGFRVGGKIKARLAEIGDRVEAGTPLARLDPADLALQVSALEAQLASANADAANARS